MSETGPHEDPRNQLAVGLAIVATGLLAAVLLAAGVWWWWIAFPIGGGLIPLAQGLAMRSDAEESDAGSEQQDALEALRARYARGDLTDAEFETRLERLLETETVEDAHESLQRGRRSEHESTATRESTSTRDSTRTRESTRDGEREVE